MGRARRLRPRRRRGLRRLPGRLPPRPRLAAGQRVAGLGLRAVGAPVEPGLPAGPRRARPPGGGDRRGRRGRALRALPAPVRPVVAAGRAERPVAAVTGFGPGLPAGRARRRRAGRGRRASPPATPTGGAAARSASSTTPTTTSSTRLHDEIGRRFLAENALNPFAFPSLGRMEAEVVAAASALTHLVDGGGTMSSGGTESIFLAVHTAREWAPRAGRRPSRRSSPPAPPTRPSPRPATTSASSSGGSTWAPTCGPTRRRSPRRSTTDVVLLVASAPCYPFGVIDPVTEIAALAADARHPLPRRRLPRRLAAAVLGAARRAGAAVGLPHARRHVVVGRRAQVRLRLQGRQRRSSTATRRWCAGSGSSSTTGPAGSTARPRPPAPGRRRRSPGRGPPSATSAPTATWPRPRVVRDTTRRFLEGIEAIPGLAVTGRPDLSVFEFGSPTLDIGAVGDVMDERGWHLDRQQGGLHLMVSPVPRPRRRRLPRRPGRGRRRRPTAVAPAAAAPRPTAPCRRREPVDAGFAGAVLAGGASRRMGRDKALVAGARRPGPRPGGGRGPARRRGGGDRRGRRRRGVVAGARAAVGGRPPPG